MARSSLLVHIVMIVIASAIGYLYIYPTIVQIRQNQDTAVVFSKEVAQVSAVNAQLQQKLSAINNIPLQDKQRLITYMPDTLDDVVYMRIMEAILKTVGIEPDTLQFGSGKSKNGNQSGVSDEAGQDNLSTNSLTSKNTISISFETDEASLFNFFTAIEQSAVPFVIKEAILTPGEKSGINAELTYLVQSLAPVEANLVEAVEAIEMNNFDPSI